MKTVSVIIPAYNAEHFLKDALESVFRQQGDEKIEIIVVDDGSTDGTAMIAGGYPSVIYLNQEHQGAAQARNKGLSNCSAEYIAFLDADDLFTENKLALQMAILQSDAQVDAVFGHVSEFVDENGAAKDHRQPVKYARAYLPGTTLMRRSFAEVIGPFDTSLRVGEFVDWYARARAKGLREVMLSDVVLLRRIHKNNLGLSESGAKQDYVTVLRAHLKRVRQGSTTQ